LLGRPQASAPSPAPPPPALRHLPGRRPPGPSCSPSPPPPRHHCGSLWFSSSSPSPQTFHFPGSHRVEQRPGHSSHSGGKAWRGREKGGGRKKQFLPACGRRCHHTMGVVFAPPDRPRALSPTTNGAEYPPPPRLRAALSTQLTSPHRWRSLSSRSAEGAVTATNGLNFLHLACGAALSTHLHRWWRLSSRPAGAAVTTTKRAEFAFPHLRAELFPHKRAEFAPPHQRGELFAHWE